MTSGCPGRDLRGGFGYGAGSAVKMQFQQRADGLLKRSLTETERQQQMQQEIYLRSVKHKADFIPSSADLSFAIPNSTAWSFQAETDSEKKSAMTDRLLELERQLLADEDEESISGSVTNSEWSETMEMLMSAPPPPVNDATKPRSLSPSSSSGSSSSGAPASAAPSRQLLLDTAAAINEGSREAAAAKIAVLKRSANPLGDPEQRLTAMMVAALESRMNPSASDMCISEHQAASQLLYEASPCFKLSLVAANLAILEATKLHSKIHILDFDIGQGDQVVSLINAISDRHRHESPARQPPCLKITAVCPPPDSGATNLRAVGDRLAKLAERKGVGLRFSIVSGRIQDLNHSANLLCEPGEALAVNFAFFLSRVADESVSPANPRDELLRRVKSLSPRIVTLVEQEMNGNTAPFAARFAESCAHYGSLLESLDAIASRESSDRARLEACLARKAVNCISREGAERVERCEVHGKWRARMGMAGFNPVPVAPAVSEPVRLRLASLRKNPGFTLREDPTWLGCGWMGRVLTVASAWR